jgi:hypothetical protein
MKILIGLGQAIFAVFTLYKTRGDQIARYGYAAFGLTVAPYAFMSIINLVGNYFCPTYPAMYMVESSVMAEARARGGYFHGVVGKLAEVSKHEKIELTTDVTGAWWIRSITFNQREEDEHELSATFRIAVEPPDENSMPPTSDLAKNSGTQVELQYQDKEYTIAVHPDDFLFTSDPERRAHGYYHHDSILYVPSFPAFKEATSQGGKAPGLAITVSDSPARLPIIRRALEHSTWHQLAELLPGLLPLPISLIPLAVTGGLTHFHPGSSTVPQRVWIMVWLCMGILYGYMFGEYISTGELVRTSHKRLSVVAEISREKKRNWVTAAILISAVSVYGTPAFGTFVMVGQMLMDYGTCIRIP